MKKNVLAEAISKIFDPVALAMIILLVAIYKSYSMSFNLQITWSMIVVILNGLLPFLFYIKYLKKGYNFDSPLSQEKHRERIKIFYVLLVVVVVEVVVLYFTGGYQPLLAVFTGGFLATILAIIITYYWKISLHAAVVTFFVVMIMIIFGFQYWYAVFLIPIVFWSRLALKRHTLLQLLAGMMLAIVIMLETFFVYGLI